MPQQVDNAMIVMLDRICEDEIGRKLRVAGRMLTYDAETTLVLLHDASNALLVDDPNIGHRWALERKSYVYASTVSKDVLRLFPDDQTELPIPMLPAYLPPPDIDPSLVMRAVIIVPVTRDFSTGRVREMLAGLAEVPPVAYPECAGEVVRQGQS